MPEAFHVYILASNNRRTLYIGVTNSLSMRLQQHREQAGEGFAARYHVMQLVYHETYADSRDAIAREKQLKGWRRAKKIALIEQMNPGWHDLSAEILEQRPRIDEPLAAEEMT